MVAGGDLDACGAWDAAVALAEAAGLPVWATPAPGGGRIGFPEGHPHFRGVLPPAIGPAGQALEGHDLVLVAGSSVFPYYPYIPGPPLPEGAELVAITRDPDEAARAPVGDAIVADPRLTLEALVEAVAAGVRPAPEPQPAPGPPEESDPIGGGQVHTVLADVLPEDGIVVVESPSSTAALRTRLRISRPGSYYFSAGGGLGFGLAAGIGVQLAQPDRPVVCVLGEGSAQYAVTGFWTAAAYDVPVTFLVLNNSEYSILKWFAGMEQVQGAPGLDLAALDTAARGRRVRRAVAQGGGHRRAARGADRGAGVGRPEPGRGQTAPRDGAVLDGRQAGSQSEAQHRGQARRAAAVLAGLGDHRVHEHHQQRAGREAVDARAELARGHVGQREAGHGGRGAHDRDARPRARRSTARTCRRARMSAADPMPSGRFET